MQLTIKLANWLCGVRCVYAIRHRFCYFIATRKRFSSQSSRTECVSLTKIHSVREGSDTKQYIINIRFDFNVFIVLGYFKNDQQYMYIIHILYVLHIRYILYDLEMQTNCLSFNCLCNSIT